MEDSSEPLTKISDLNTFSKRVFTVAKVISVGEPREVTFRADDSQHRVADALIADDTGSVYLTLFDEAIDEMKEDSVININNGYIRVYRGSMRLNIGRYGSYEVAEEDPFDELNLENNVSAEEVQDHRRTRDQRNWDQRRRYR
ncbi:single-stranded DNA-binding protein [Candidatus Bathyarchaeota archaeon]|nr:single-stranded DNA-binding protein [Candidatus Bathyarchaeota archaeon]